MLKADVLMYNIYFIFIFTLHYVGLSPVINVLFFSFSYRNY